MSQQIRGRSFPYKAWVRNLPFVVMSYNCSPNRITGLSPHEIMFGRPPSFPLAHPNASFPAPTVENLSDRMFYTLHALNKAHEHISQKLEVRRDQIKAMFDKFRRLLKISVGDYAYVYYPQNQMLRKLHPKAFGPYPVVRVSFLPGTRDPIGITLDIGTEDEPNYRRFPRARVHPFSFTLRDIDWCGLSERAAECRQDSQEFLDEFTGSLDLNSIEKGGNRRIHRRGVLTDRDLRAESCKLIRYLDHNRASLLSQPVAKRSMEEIPLPTKEWSPDIGGHPYFNPLPQ